MGHLRTQQADTDLDGIWYDVATKSGSVEIAGRMIDSLTADSFYLPAIPIWAVPAMRTYVPTCALSGG